LSVLSAVKRLIAFRWYPADSVLLAA